MVIDIILVVIGLLALIIGTITDIKTREIPDWVSYSLIFIGLGLRLIHSLITSEWMFFAWGVIGAVVFAAAAFLMFFSGQWGGGDTKLLIGLGAMFGSYPAFLLNYFTPMLKGTFLLAIVLNIFLVGALFGILYTFYLAIRNFSKFKKEFIAIMKKRKTTITRRVILLSSTLILIALFFVPDFVIKLAGAVIVFMTVLTFHMFIVVKAVESVCMFKKIEVSKLVEGDWIAEDVKVKGKLIYKVNKIGAELKDINRLKKYNIKKVLVKEGIPFIPSFLAGFIVSLIWGNVLLRLLGI